MRAILKHITRLFDFQRRIRCRRSVQVIQQAQLLEQRAMLASVQDSGNTLQLELRTGEGLQISATIDGYDFTSTTSVFANGGVTNTTDFSEFGTASLMLTNSSRYTHVQIIDGAEGTYVEFPNSGTGRFRHHFEIVMDQVADSHAVRFRGSADFEDNDLIVHATGTVSLNNSADLRVYGGNINITAVNRTAGAEPKRGIEISGGRLTSSGPGNIELNGTGGTGSGGNDGVWITAGGGVTSLDATVNAGGITLNGTGGIGTDWNRGFVLADEATVETVNGDIILNARGGTGGDFNHGIHVDGGRVISTGRGSDAGDVRLFASRGNGIHHNIAVTLNQNADIGEISTFDGSINIYGATPGSVTGVSNHGVWIGLPLTVENSGWIDIRGNGGAGSHQNRGVHIENTTLETHAGGLRIAGHGGHDSADRSDGFFMSGGLLRATDILSVFGDAGNNESHGIAIDGLQNGDVRIETQGPGDILLSGYGHQNSPATDDLRLIGNVVVNAKTTGDIVFNADTVEIDSASQIEGNGRLTFKTSGGASQRITLGGESSFREDDLNLTDEELSTIGDNFQKVQFGHLDQSGNDVFVLIDTVELTHDVEIRGGVIRDSEGDDLQVASVELHGQVRPGYPSGVLNLTNGMLAFGSSLTLQLDGEMAGAGAGYHGQVSASGELHIDENVNLSLVWTPLWRPAGGEELVLIERSGGSGEFANRPEGSSVQNEFGSPEFYGAQITYRGGDGDDIAIVLPDDLEGFPVPQLVDLGFPPGGITTIYGESDRGRTGQTVAAAGDVDHDGYDDFLIAASNADGLGAAFDAGRVYLLYGSPDPDFEINLADTDVRRTVFIGEDLNDLISDVAAGDINGDGYNDIIIGAQFGDGPQNQRENSGQVYVIWGGPDLGETIELGSVGDGGMRVWGADPADSTGSAVSYIGDLNNDGFGDFAVAAPNAESIDNSRELAGEATIIFGGPSLPTEIDLATATSGVMRIYGADSRDGFRIGLSSQGDFNGDDVDDLAIGFPYGSGVSNEILRAGEVHLIYGREDLPGSLDLVNGADVTIFGAFESGFAGSRLDSRGDVNGDGLTDLLIGAPEAATNINNRPDAGQSYLIWGGESLPPVIRISDLGGSGVRFLGSDAGDRAGADVSIVGDLNADGFDDIAIGATSGDGGTPVLRQSSGEVFLILGGELNGDIDLRDRESVALVLAGPAFGDQLGNSISGVGDTNGDGFDEFAVGASLSHSFNDSIGDGGEAYLIPGISLFAAEVPTVTSPVGRISGRDAKITWTEAAKAVSYELWLQRIGAASNPFLNEKEIVGTEFESTNLPLGRYRAWLRANRADGSTSPWRSGTFSVTDTATIDTVVESGVDGFSVSWDTVAGATEYRVYISNLTERQNALVDMRVTDNSFTASNLDFGLHRVWVQPVGPGDFRGTWSQHADYDIGPEPISPVASVSSRPTFTWTDVKGVASVQIYVQFGSSVVVNQSGITGTEFTPQDDLQPGQYRWWVRGTSTNGRLSGWSSAGLFTVGTAHVIGPQSDVVDGLAELRWLEVEGVATYEVYLHSESTNQLVQRETGIVGQAFTTRPLPRGDYLVWVRPFRADGTAERWSRQHPFRVRPSATVQALPTEPLQPTFDRTPTFQWNASTNATAFNVHLSNAETVIYETGITGQAWTPVSELAPGTWNWRVQAMSATGNYGEWSEEFSIDTSGRTVVLGFEVSQQPVVRWAAVTGAVRYVLQIDDLGSNQTVIHEDNLSETSFATSNLVSGSYRTWVRAVSAEGAGPWSIAFDFAVG